jgi:hypothetical protein
MYLEDCWTKPNTYDLDLENQPPLIVNAAAVNIGVPEDIH